MSVILAGASGLSAFGAAGFGDGFEEGFIVFRDFAPVLLGRFRVVLPRAIIFAPALLSGASLRWTGEGTHPHVSFAGPIVELDLPSYQ